MLTTLNFKASGCTLKRNLFWGIFILRAKHESHIFLVSTLGFLTSLVVRLPSLKYSCLGFIVAPQVYLMGYERPCSIWKILLYWESWVRQEITLFFTNTWTTTENHTCHICYNIGYLQLVVFKSIFVVIGNSCNV